MSEEVIEKSTDERRWLLYEENFRKIVNLQKEISEETEVSPSFRILLNKIVEAADVTPLKGEMIKKLSM